MPKALTGLQPLADVPKRVPRRHRLRDILEIIPCGKFGGHGSAACDQNVSDIRYSPHAPRRLGSASDEEIHRGKLPRHMKQQLVKEFCSISSIKRLPSASFQIDDLIGLVILNRD